MNNIDKAKFFSEIVTEHSGNAEFLWLLRSQAVTRPQQTHAAIGKLEHRINRHLLGLFASPELAWELALESAEPLVEGGNAFTLAIERGMENDNKRKGLLSALC